METVTLSSALAAAALLGCAHTLAGPDHYVPLIAVGRMRGWSQRRLMGVTVACGVAHCAVAVAVVLAVLAAMGSAAWEAVQAWRSDLVAMLLIGLGLAMVGVALRRTARRENRSAGRWAGMLVLVFVLGPCEWLAPIAMAAAAQHGVSGALLAASAFSVATVLTMSGAVVVGSYGVVWLGRAGSNRCSRGPEVLPRGVVAGACVAASGCLILLGL